MQQLIRKVLDDSGGVGACIALLSSGEGAFIALEFLQSIHPAKNIKEKKACYRLSALPKYQKLLIEAIRTENYEKIAEHISNELSLPDEVKTPQVSRTNQNQFAAVFKTKYYGNAAEELYNYLEQADREFTRVPGRFYAKYISIVQSSGTGKSRALIELKEKDVVVVYMNLRSEALGNPYPLRDDVPAGILTENLKCSRRVYSHRCTTFFAATFGAVKEHLVDLRKQYKSRHELVKAWSQQMCEMDNEFRETFFSRLQAIYDEAIGDSGNTEGQKDTRLESLIANLGVKDNQSASEGAPAVKMSPSSSGELTSNDTKTPALQGELQMKAAYDELIRAVPELFENRRNSPCLVLAIDEAHPLREPQEQFLPSHVLCQAISSLSAAQAKISTWVVFASTTSKVADFSAPAHIHPSLRVSLGGKLLFMPYSDFGWDQHAPSLALVKPENVAQFGNIVRFGRPLKLALNDELTLSAHRPDSDHSRSGFNPNNFNQALAVLGQRFLLDVCFGSRDWIEFQETAVSSHLRVCVDTHDDRQSIETMYPSEPLLSCAAAQLLYLPDSAPDQLFNIAGPALNQLYAAIESHLVDKGLKGELISRIIYLMGKDFAVRTCLKPSLATDPSAPVELLDCRPLPVIDYLSVMFGESVFGQDTRSLFDGWNVNFSHWIGMDEKIRFEGSEDKSAAEMEDWLARHWTRTCAVQCCHNQHSIDKVIPMYKFRKSSEPKSSKDTHAGRVSFILISDKAKEKASASDLATISPVNAKFPALDQPYIAILADLGWQEPKKKKEQRERVVATIDRSSGIPVLRISALGLGSETYPFLTGDVVGLVRRMLHVPNKQDHLTTGRKKLRNRIKYGRESTREGREWDK